MKNGIISFLTIIISVLFIFLGNKIAGKGVSDYTNGQRPESTEAIVTHIVKRTTQNYDLEDGKQHESENTVFKAKILSGKEKDKVVKAAQSSGTMATSYSKNVAVGDKIILTKCNDTDNHIEWAFENYVRTDSLLALGIIFLLMLLIFGRSKGLNTIISLVFTCLAIFFVLIPAILSGKNIYFWAILTNTFIIVMTYLIVNGANAKSLAAGLGCLGGVLLSGIITAVMSPILQLTGIINEESLFLLNINEKNPIDLKAIVFASVLIGAIGAIMDVAMSISSSLFEISQKSSQVSFHSIFKSGITIGRDVMGTMTNTLILAYIGGSLSIVLLLVAYNTSLPQLLNLEMVVVDILQALVGSFGILLTIPFTSFISAALYSKGNSRSR